MTQPLTLKALQEAYDRLMELGIRYYATVEYVPIGTCYHITGTAWHPEYFLFHPDDFPAMHVPGVSWVHLRDRKPTYPNLLIPLLDYPHKPIDLRPRSILGYWWHDTGHWRNGERSSLITRRF